MKLYYNNFFIKSLLLLILLLIINLPINNLLSFCLFLFFIPVIFFSLISKNNNYFYIFFFILIYFVIEVFIPKTKIHEGHNLVIITENSKDFYKKAQNAFIKIAKKNKKRYLILDNSNDSENVEKIILNRFIKIVQNG